MVPETIIYNPSAEINSVVDLSTLVTKTPVTTPKGTYPILKRADDSFSSVAELQENPSLAAPEFTDVDWSVATYRGAIPISEESIADAQVDLTSLIGQNIGEKRVNTVNKLISPVLEGFTAVSTTSSTLADDIKQVLNVKLDQAYARDLVVSASFYQILDTLKDNNGQYLLHQDITGKSGTTIFGVPVHIVNDTLLGADGEAHAFIGDLKRGVLFVDRQEVSLAWMKSEIYGQYLGAAMRFGVSKADENAGYFLTVSK
ncbi:phage major capsid protein [Lactiplantibacillus plantarum]|nr:phage major capsid protein [Lactiplantibacillus plantarum]